jgi:ABC-type Zn2+ transport system substrate-binding protein/surface adhesin
MTIKKTAFLKLLLISLLSFMVGIPTIPAAASNHESHSHETEFPDHHQTHHDNIDDTQLSHRHTHKHGEGGEEHEHNHSHHSHIDLTTKTLFLSKAEFRLIEMASTSCLSESVMISDPHPSSIFRPPIV